MHREIDTFTDSHHIVSNSKNILRGEFNHYSGVIVDVFYDYFLAKDWSRWSGSEQIENNIELIDFTKHAYKVFHAHYEILPERNKNIHEQNASTSTVRSAGSSGANPFACIAAGIASLWGPSHGGANEAVINMLNEIGGKQNIPGFLSRVKDKGDHTRLMGFGHRVYKNYDPRAKVMRQTCHEVLTSLGIDHDPLLELAMEMEQIALKDDYFISKKLYPNVDFYSGIIFRAIGIPTSMFTVLFAVARTVGWISQWNEMIEDPDQKIGRPRQLYSGQTERPYKPLHMRG